jgi:uncharacterized membrane protein YbhN (UPF0104 family)
VRLRSLLLVVASLAISVALIAVLVAVSKVDLRGVLLRLGSMDGRAFAKLSLLAGLNTYLSTQKWRLMDCVMRRSTDPELPTSTAFAMTSAGNALGQILPMQVSMVVARTLGIWVHGRALRRGTVGTLFEQGFDFLAVCFLMAASACTRLLRGNATMWLMLAIPAALAALLVVGAVMRLLARINSYLSTSLRKKLAPLSSTLAELQESGLLEVSLGRRLMALSLARFGVLVLMASQTTATIHADIPLWHLAAAMPFVVLSSALAITPGGLGINELTYATALDLFGTPLTTGAAWALANRLLIVAASFAVAIVALGLFLALNVWYRVRSAPKPIPSGEEEANF